MSKSSTTMKHSSHFDFVLSAVLGGLLIVINVGHTAFAEVASTTNLTEHQTQLLPYREESAVLMAELVKLLLSMCFLLRAYLSRSLEYKNRDDVLPCDAKPMTFRPTPKIVASMAVPAFLYTISNILSYTVVGLLGSTRYQLYSNIKIIITAVTFRCVMGQVLKIVQWLCLFLLIAGLLIAVDGHKNLMDESISGSKLLPGICMMILLSLTSSFAGVFSELKLKQEPQHIMLQSALMYIWSCLFCLTKYKMEQAYDGSFFQGFSLPLWGAIMTTAMYGQAVAFTLFYCDNLVKIFANSVTVIVSASVDYTYFGKEVSPALILAGFIVFGSTITFYCDHTLLLEPDIHLLRKFQVWRNALFLGGLIIGSSFLTLNMWRENEIRPAGESHYPQTLLRQNTSNDLLFDESNKGLCDWPLPLYSNLSTFDYPSRPSLISSMRELESFFDLNEKTTFSYIDSGGALGIYRDGSLIPTDSDLDLRFGVCQICDAEVIGKIPTALVGFLSLNNFERWGDVWTRRQLPCKVDQVMVDEIRKDLCRHEYTSGESYWFHKSKMQRRAFTYTYGDFWFVRLPWKGMHNLDKWHEYAKANKEKRMFNTFQNDWDKSLSEIAKIDANGDMLITVEELDRRVIADGIEETRYRSQIRPRERCRAAAQLTLILQFNENPHPIAIETGHIFTSNDHPMFNFVKCEQNEQDVA